MAKMITFFMLVLFLSLSVLFLSLSVAISRPISSTTKPGSTPQEPSPSNIPMGSSPEGSNINDGESCSELESEECLIRRSMVAHTDYIYTQAISGP